MARIILYTGKGGVGKTTTAAATAAETARRGLKTLVISTDPAHSLGDALDMKLGPEPKEIKPNLYAQEIDVYYSIDKYWGKLRSYIQSLFNWMNVDDILAEEFSVFPGMEEVSCFLWVYSHYTDDTYDVIVVDSAPTGETLRLLSLPDVARWWIVKVFPIERKLLKVVRPAVKVVSDMPLPEEKTYDAIEDLFEKLDAIHKVFSDSEITSIRLVMNLEKMVIKETQRAYTYLNLYGYPVDAIVLNRTMPEELDHPYFKEWRKYQQAYRKEVDEHFSPLPTLEAPLFPKEVMGWEDIEKFGATLFANTNPSDIMYDDKPYHLEKEEGEYKIYLKLPFVKKRDVDLHQVGDELTIQVDNQRRNIFLPNFLAKMNVKKAHLESGVLQITFKNHKGKANQ